MDVIDEIMQQREAEENASIHQARSDSNWARTFNSIPSVERLRAARDLTSQVNSAIERRQALAAQTDLKSQAIYYNSKKFEFERSTEPVRKQLLDAQLEQELAQTQAMAATELRKKQEETLASKAAADSAMAHYELTNHLNIPDLKVRKARIDALPEKFPNADANFHTRLKQTQSELEPKPAVSPEESIAFSVAKEKAMIQARKEGEAVPDGIPEKVRLDHYRSKKELAAAQAALAVDPEDKGAKQAVASNQARIDTDTQTYPGLRPKQPTPAQAAAVDATRPVFKDANGRRAYKNPDGSYEEIP